MSPRDLPLLDLEVIDELYTLSRLGHRDVLTDLADGIGREWPQIESQVRRAVANNDLPDLRSAVHKLKGLAGTAGLARLAGLALQIEDAALSGLIDHAGIVDLSLAGTESLAALAGHINR